MLCAVLDWFLRCNLLSLFKHRGADVDVKKLNKRPAPPRFGRKLTETQKASILLSVCFLRLSM